MGCWIEACRPPRRKISLPWFRQASLGERLTRLRLPRQHTLDCPPPHDTGGGGGPSGHAPWPKSAPTYAERFRYSRKAMSGSASVEVSWTCNKESFEMKWGGCGSGSANNKESFVKMWSVASASNFWSGSASKAYEFGFRTTRCIIYVFKNRFVQTLYEGY